MRPVWKRQKGAMHCAPTSMSTALRKSALLIVARLQTPLWRRALVGPAILQAAFQIFVWLPQHLEFRDDNRDLFIYHATAQRVLDGKPIYVSQLNYGPDQVPTTFLYPPAFAAAIAPLGRLSLPDFSRLWYLLLVASFWIYATALARMATHRFTPQSTLIAGLVLMACPGTMVGMSLGNAQPIVHALWGLALAGGAQWRGAALAASALIKIHPLWPLLLAWRWEKKSIAPSIGILGMGAILGWVVCGVQSHGDWWKFAQPVVGQGSFVPGNVSLSFAVLRILKYFGWAYEGGPLPVAAKSYLALVTVAAPCISMWVVRQQKPKMQMAIVGSVAVLFAPLCWSSYLPMLLAPLALWLRDAWDEAQS